MSLTPTEPILIVSDLHLGHRVCAVRSPSELEPLMGHAQTLVLNGDTAEMRTGADRVVGRQAAAEVARIAHENGVKVIFINGNHDPTISKQDHLDLADGNVLVTHGDILFLGVAPWSPKAKAFRTIHRRVLTDIGPDALYKFEKRLLATKRTAIKLQMLHRPLTHGRFATLRLLARQFWPPYRPFMILKAWIDTPRLATELIESLRPQTRVIIIGHTHRPGVWKRHRRIVINTGGYVPSVTALAVLIEGKKLEVRRVERVKQKLALGKLKARFEV
jgi:UDP-2,3-diacylglucosamine pyrophosphatase LpxH